MNETEAHKVRRDLELSSFFSFVSGCFVCVGAYMSKDGLNFLAGFFFLLSVIAAIVTVMIGSRKSEEVKEDG